MFSLSILHVSCYHYAIHPLLEQASMKNVSAKKADLFFHADNSPLHRVFAKIKQLNALNSRLSTFLDENLRKNCQVANLNGHCLVLLVNTGTAATQLRFIIPDLLQKFRLDPELRPIQDIQCKVRPVSSGSSATKPLRNVTPLSRQTASIIEEIAESITEPKLKKALLRIAKHTA